jgi:hypothetical protein
MPVTLQIGDRQFSLKKEGERETHTRTEMGCLRGSKWKAAGFLVGSALCTALSGLQSVMVTSWLQPFLLLQFLHRIVVVVVGDQSSGKRTRTSSSSWGRLLLLFLLTLLVQSLGFTVAFGGMFNDPSFTLPGVLVAAACFRFHMDGSLAPSSIKSAHRIGRESSLLASVRQTLGVDG